VDFQLDLAEAGCTFVGGLGGPSPSSDPSSRPGLSLLLPLGPLQPSSPPSTPSPSPSSPSPSAPPPLPEGLLPAAPPAAPPAGRRPAEPGGQSASPGLASQPLHCPQPAPQRRGGLGGGLARRGRPVQTEDAWV